MYIRPPAKKINASFGETSRLIGPTQDSRIEVNMRSMLSSPSREITELVVMPFDNAASPYSCRRSPGLVTICAGSGT